MERLAEQPHKLLRTVAILLFSVLVVSPATGEESQEDTRLIIFGPVKDSAEKIVDIVSLVTTHGSWSSGGNKRLRADIQAYYGEDHSVYGISVKADRCFVLYDNGSDSSGTSYGLDAYLDSQDALSKKIKRVKKRGDRIIHTGCNTKDTSATPRALRSMSGEILPQTEWQAVERAPKKHPFQDLMDTHTELRGFDELMSDLEVDGKTVEVPCGNSKDPAILSSNPRAKGVYEIHHPSGVAKIRVQEIAEGDNADIAFRAFDRRLRSTVADLCGGGDQSQAIHAVYSKILGYFESEYQECMRNAGKNEQPVSRCSGLLWRVNKVRAAGIGIRG